MAYTIAALEAELPSPEMNALVTEILASSLGSIGLFRQGHTTIADLNPEKTPAPYYERWLNSSIDYLRQQQILGADGMFVRDVRGLAELWEEWEARRGSWAMNPNAQAQSTLLEVCLRAVPGIMSGRQRATDVMFPGSSMHLVEGIYRGNPQANYFNEILGQTLAGRIEELLRTDPERKIRIVEIGAGTGGTTAALLPMLQPYPVEEYCYTDLSRAFLMHAEKSFLPQLPALTTAIFDVSKPLDTQPIAANRYDFAIAANVLHATADIRETLRNAKAVLRNQGVLLLNEIAAWSLFNHLTFGLLEGWWLYEDSSVRLPGSPGLAPEKWREILAEEGFVSIVFPAEEAHRLGQQIVAAVSDGWTRQRIVKNDRPQPAAEVKVPELAAARPARSTEPPEQAVADHTRRIITAKLSEALRMDAALIRDDASFADFGVDSIVGVNLVRNISEALRIDLETTSLFEYSTVEQLTAYILTNWRDQIAGQVAPGERPAAKPIPVRDEVPAAVDAGRPPRFLGATRFASVRDARDRATSPDDGGLTAEPIAIIGMSGRFAESESLDSFWENLAQGKDLVKPVTRWSATDCVVSGGSDRAYCSHGSFIDSIDRFDPAFFGISAIEATYMDPQQRLFLEESWRALEDAGYAGKSVQEKQCGVYVGCGSSSYDKLSGGDAPPQAFWGNSQAVTPARIAYCLDLQGPAMAIDTACSSSLVAIHLACLGLWARETEMALAGGVFLQPTPGFYQVANRAGMLSPEGKCRSFDVRADGFVPGEGVGVVVLKRLRDAMADGDHVHGVIAASGINQDGRSNGLIAPNGRAQERLERSVYERFKIDPGTIQVLEAHGTGTLLGDSIEYGAISRVFREHTDKKRFCALGTVKTNIGHTSTAAGVAAVLKLLLSLRQRQIPPSLHFENGNPAIDSDSSPFFVNTELRPWETEDGAIRRAAVSSFGFSGTNAHLILDEAPVPERELVESPGALVVLSARTSEQLHQQARNLLAHLERTSGIHLNDLSFTLLTGRMHLNHRLACVARSRNELMQQLAQWIETGAASQTFAAEIQDGKVREQVSLKKFGNYCIQQCRETSDEATVLENLAAIGELYVQGYSLDFQSLFAEDVRRVPLPTYPFAGERYWVDAARMPAPAYRPALAATAPPPSMQRRTPHPGRNGHETSLAAWLQDELSHIACGILGVNQSDVAADRVLVDLGFDSVGLTSFANAINQKFRLDITPVLFFDYPSLREIAKHLSTERQDDIRPFHGSAATTPRQPEPVVAGTARISAEPRAAYEPIAIVGIAGVMPQSEDLDALWEGLRSSRDMITVIPEDRWNWEDYYGDPLREVNKSNSRWGGFMKEVDKFDPLFFGISPREAQMMDPQQRIFLETVWKAIEDSGQKPSELGGTRTGVFVGVGSNDYIDILRSHPIALDGYTASGNSHSVLANRVSFLLDLRGPSAPIDTACSSSLVALHRAVESIRAGNCDMAIAGGVQVILSPGAYISFGKAGMLSSDGKCRTFDRRANGYVRGEGCGVVLLKPLSLAEADGNHIYAVIRSTAENHGGRVTTMTAPNSAAQAALLIEAYEKANIDPTTVGYIECHGTGTSLGDPIEVQALTKAFGELYKRHNRAPAATPHCGLGTIKSNIGHLETAAGIAGVLKVVLALHRKEIPATIHFEELNPFINLKGTPFSIVDELTPWQAAVGEDGAPLPRRAGVSSFGFGGANAHAVLEEYVAHERPGSSTGPQLIVLSAKNADRLNAYVQSMRAYVEKRAFNLADFAYTLQIGREEMPERLAFAVTSIEELRRTFDAIVAGPLPEGCYRNHVAGDESTTADEARIASLIEKKDLARLAELWVSGASIDWHLLHDSGGPRRISVPTYPFARVRYWIPSAEGRFRPTMEPARAGAVQEEPAAVLRSLVPAWHPVPAESIRRIAVSESTRVLLLGADASDLDWVRTSYPAAELLELAPSASADEIAKMLAASLFDQLLWIAPETGDDAPLVAQQESGVLSVFRIVKALLGLGYASRPLQWTLMTGRAHCVRESEPIAPAHAGVAGFIGSIAKELPHWELRMLDVDSRASITPHDCLSLPWDREGNTLARRGGDWFQQRLDVLADRPRTETVIRRNGVYVVIGGARGIGEVWTRSMIEQYQAHVVWIGRRAYDDSIERSVRALSGVGPAPLYIQADATDVGALEQARRTILRTHPAIHGVVHSALVLHDRTIARMDEAGFRAGLAAKVDVSVNLDRVFGGDELDFMLFFSSIVSFLKPAGQSNYAAGCTFADSFARGLHQRRAYPVKVMNWGYWGDVGVAADATSRQRMARFGIGSIEPHEGLAALQALMSSDVPQVAFVKTVHQAGAGVDAAASLKAGEPAGEDVAAHVREVITGAMCEELRIEAAVINPNASLADYGVDSIVGVNLVSRISESLKVPLEASSLFEYSSVNRLASYIVANWKQQIARAAAPADVGSEVSAEAGANVELAALPEGSACVEMLPVLRDSEGEIDDNEILEQVLWQDTSVDDSYEKVTF